MNRPALRPKTRRPTSPPAWPARRRSLLSRARRSAARVAAWASDPQLSFVLAVGFTIAHVVLWTAILTQLKAAQDVHFDVSEAYAWGQKFLLGYGKHPPLSGWIAGVWFSFFPAADWAAYALAMTTVGIGMLATWGIALHVVDRRRAFFVLVMVALYPIFNFKGFKYNADLVQLISLPLLVLAYLHAFEKRTIRSGVLLGLAGALALMSKYWVVTMIGAIGLAALMHPKRMQFLRSPAPWLAIVTMVAAMIPHVQWVRSVDYAPFLYAGHYAISSYWESLQLVWGYVGHNVALLLLPLAIAAAVLGWAPRWWTTALRAPGAFFARSWSLRGNPAVDRDQALNIWLIQAIVAIGPPFGALAFSIYIKTDWGIPLFFLLPLAVIAIPALRVPRVALPRIAGVWLVLSLLTLAFAPQICVLSLPRDDKGNFTHVSYSQLAGQLTEIWHTRAYSRWSAVAGFIDTADQMTFYSPDHPLPLTLYDEGGSGLLTLAEAQRDGFIGICEAGTWNIDRCDAWMKEHAAGAERMVLSTRRYFNGQAGVSTRFDVYLVPPKK
ncbi:glycosyltransferase family 39 protein [Rhodopseudomonas boonkerdii]|uniref:glycosyltransferase family 39 protein n=1 Tax=Rhodopseudomonas boonkerdii TaxID=475937 RepID=UPI001E339B51|nr:glycosyltransferase family 39 protein [Rhodopseudomonas boonkerdii]UGV28320.1 glycosyltransferase family 39 protein [Rhodopseudomonas boonkerdii]